MVNAWFLYKLDAKTIGVVKTYPPRHFQAMESEGLLKCQKVSCGCSSIADLTTPAKKKRKAAPRPLDDSRYDNVAHWSLPTERETDVICALVDIPKRTM